MSTPSALSSSSSTSSSSSSSARRRERKKKAATNSTSTTVANDSTIPGTPMHAAAAATASASPTSVPVSNGNGGSSSRVSVPLVPLTDLQMQQFIADGYIMITPSLPPSYHSDVYARIGEVFDGQGNPGNNLLPALPMIQQLLRDPIVDGALTSLLGPLYMTQPHRHPHQSLPGKRTQQWHKDSYFGYTKHRHHRPHWVMLMYYPQDTTLEMGPTAIMPGTHQLADPAGDHSRHLGMIPKHWPTTDMNVIVPAGTVCIIHYDLWHKGTANISKIVRYMFKFQFVRMIEPSSIAAMSPTSTASTTPSPSSPLSSLPWRHDSIEWKYYSNLLDRKSKGPAAEFARQRLRIWLDSWYWLRGKSWHGDTSLDCKDSTIESKSSSSSTVTDTKDDPTSGTNGSGSDKKVDSRISELVRDLQMPTAVDPQQVNTAYSLVSCGTAGYDALLRALYSPSLGAARSAAYGLIACGSPSTVQTIVPVLMKILQGSPPSGVPDVILYGDKFTPVSTNPRHALSEGEKTGRSNIHARRFRGRGGASRGGRGGGASATTSTPDTTAPATVSSPAVPPAVATTSSSSSTRGRGGSGASGRGSGRVTGGRSAAVAMVDDDAGDDMMMNGSADRDVPLATPTVASPAVAIGPERMKFGPPSRFMKGGGSAAVTSPSAADIAAASRYIRPAGRPPVQPPLVRARSLACFVLRDLGPLVSTVTGAVAAVVHTALHDTDTMVRRDATEALGTIIAGSILPTMIPSAATTTPTTTVANKTTAAAAVVPAKLSPPPGLSRPATATAAPSKGESKAPAKASSSPTSSASSFASTTVASLRDDDDVRLVVNALITLLNHVTEVEPQIRMHASFALGKLWCNGCNIRPYAYQPLTDAVAHDNNRYVIGYAFDVLQRMDYQSHDQYHTQGRDMIWNKWCTLTNADSPF